MKKTTLMITLVEALVIILAAVIITYNPQGGVTGMAIHLPDNCSDLESQRTWESVFKESFLGTFTIKEGEPSDTNCSFVVFENKSEGMYLLMDIDNEILALFGKFNETIIEGIDTASTVEEIVGIIEDSSEEDIMNRSVAITSVSEADTTFALTFKHEPETWELSGDEKKYVSDEDITSQIYKDISYSSLGYSIVEQETPSANCTPQYSDCTSWSNCTSSEKRTRTCIDIRECDPDNLNKTEEKGCDYDGNGLAGGKADIEKQRVSLNIKIADEILNESKDYNGTKKVEFLDGSDVLVEFEWNFSNALDFVVMEISKQGNISDAGYTIVNGINVNKTIYVEKLSLGSDSICVIDAEIGSTDEISDDCNDSDEILIDCPGEDSTSDIICSIESGFLKITGLMHSAVKEMPENCTPLNCSNMGFECGVHTETNCNTQINCGTCDIDEECINGTCQVVEPVCTPDWQCTEWQPEKCPKNETQHRECTDANDCGDITGRPPETKSCTYESSAPIMIIIIIAIILIVGAIITFLMYNAKKKESKEGDEEGGATISSTPPKPPQQPMQPMPAVKKPRMPPARPPVKPAPRPPQIQRPTPPPVTPPTNPNQPPK